MIVECMIAATMQVGTLIRDDSSDMWLVAFKERTTWVNSSQCLYKQPLADYTRDLKQETHNERKVEKSLRKD